MSGPSSSSRACARAMLLNAEGRCEALAGGFGVFGGRPVWGYQEKETKLGKGHVMLLREKDGESHSF